MVAFLSNEWFAMVNRLTKEAGDLQLPPSLANLTLNLNVTDTPNGTVPMSIVGGQLQQGNSNAATTTLTLDAQTMRKVFLEFNIAAAMQAFMGGKIQIAGDMSQLFALQSANPSAKQKELFAQILQNTNA